MGRNNKGNNGRKNSGKSPEIRVKKGEAVKRARSSPATVTSSNGKQGKQTKFDKKENKSGKETRRKINFDNIETENNNANVHCSNHIRSRSRSSSQNRSKVGDDDFVWENVCEKGKERKPTKFDPKPDNTILAKRKITQNSISFVESVDERPENMNFDGIEVMVEDDDLDYEYDSSDQDSLPVETVVEVEPSPKGVKDVDDPPADRQGTCKDGRRVVGNNLGKEFVNINELTEEQMMAISNLKNFVCKLVDERVADSRVSVGDKPGTSGPGGASGNAINDSAQVKSPSDTTIYAPALNKRFEVNDLNKHLVQINQANTQGDFNTMDREGDNQNRVMGTITNFIESIHAGTPQSDGPWSKPVTPSQPIPDKEAPPEFEQVQQRADEVLKDAERFQAKLAEPPGRTNELFMSNNFQSNQGILPVLTGGEPADGNHLVQENKGFPSIGGGVSDDDFFHLTCHIEPNLIHKIEKGEFIELEKLLPKPGGYKNGEDHRLEWVQRDGGTFLVPAVARDNKITSIHRWEQAFRAYATIYCGANPHRSKEIWQYISVINTAATAYS